MRRVKYVPFYHLVSQRENLRWQIDAERFRSLEIDDELELRYSRHWQFSGHFAF